MKNLIPLFLLSLSLLISSSFSKTVYNPVIWADVPDIDVIRVEDTYYMISTTNFFNPGAPIMKSSNMVSWEICSYVYETLADGDAQTLSNGKNEYSHGQWAASLRYKDGVFYVFFCSFSTGNSYIFKTKNIEQGPWEKSVIEGTYHDASIYFDDDGKNYLAYGGNGEIHIKELNEEMTGFSRNAMDKIIVRTGFTGLSGEGAHFYKIGDYYFLILICWPNNRRRIMVAYRSRELLGEYEGKEILDSPLGSYNQGVAQGAIFDTPSGEWWSLLFQDHGAVGRIPVLVPCHWEQDWPMLGVNGKAPVEMSFEIEKTTTVLAKSDDFDYEDNSQLDKVWQWNHIPDNKSWSVTERKGYLRLVNNNIASNVLNSKNTLTMRTEGPACSSYIKMDTSGMKNGDYAGLSAFQFNYGNVGIYVNNRGEKKIYMSKNTALDKSPGEAQDKIIEEKNLENDEVYLKIEFLFSEVKSDKSASDNIDIATFYFSYDGKEWVKIGEELKMSFDTKLFTGYRSAIYSYATNQRSRGGYTDIDTFYYERTAWN